jgi:hypothetical protein
MDEIYNFWVHHLEFEEINNKFIRVVISRALVDPEFKRASNAYRPDPADSFLAKRLREYQKNGKIRSNVDIATLSELLFGVGFQIGFLERLMFEHNDQKCRRMFKVLADSIGKGIECDKA